MKLLAFLELGPGTSYSGHCCPETKKALHSRMLNSVLVRMTMKSVLGSLCS